MENDRTDLSLRGSAHCSALRAAYGGCAMHSTAVLDCRGNPPDERASLQVFESLTLSKHGERVPTAVGGCGWKGSTF